MNHKKVLCSFTTLLMAYVFSTSMAYTSEDIDKARSIAANKAPLFGRSNPDLAARMKYYEGTLYHLMDVRKVGFVEYRESDSYSWDIENIPVLNRVNLTAINFTATIDDAISLYRFLVQNPCRSILEQ